MEKKSLENQPGSGLELDRLELPARSIQKPARKSTADSEEKNIISPGTDLSGKRHLRLTVTAVMVTLALLTAIAAYMRNQNLKVSISKLNKTTISDSHYRVGPITATIQNDEIIRLSLDIGCKNDDVKERLAEKDSRIRDKIVSVITAPETGPLLQNHQYDAIRAKIKKGLEQISGEPIGDVYFAELLTY